MISNYKQAKDYFDSFINYERTPTFSYKGSLKLERMLWLLKSLHIPYQKLKAVHIAGTKGKGSTAWFCAYLLAGCGYKTGLYTSPHFFDFRERVRIVHSPQSIVHSMMMPRKDVVRIAEDFRKKLKDFKLPEKLGKISFFEIYTAAAFKYFLKQKVDYAVIETGLGGRLDATNVLLPLASVITHIGYDHTDKLGRNLKDIAYEKSGIIKENIPLVCFRQRSGALKEIKKQCRLKKAICFLSGEGFKAQNIRLKNNGTVFDFTFGARTLKNLKIQPKRKIQVENAACALAAFFLLPQIKLTADFKIRAALKSCFLEGRFELAKKNPLTILDIAHNVSSFTALSGNLKQYFPGKKIILIFACSSDKDYKNMLKKINYSRIILTRFFNPRSLTPEEIKKSANIKSALIAEDIKAAFKQALKLYQPGWIIVISGSLFLVSETKTYFRRGRPMCLPDKDSLYRPDINKN